MPPLSIHDTSPDDYPPGGSSRSGHPRVDTVKGGYPWLHQAICLAPLALLVLALSTCVGTGDTLTAFFSAWRDASPDLTRWMAFLTDAVVRFFYALYALLLLMALLRRDRNGVRRVLVFAAVQAGLCLVFVQVAKTAIGSPRPLIALEGGTYSPWKLDNDYHSFPSGHTAEITGAASPFAVRARKTLLSLLLGCIIALIGFSRLYLSRHHLPDIIGGACVGVAASFLNFTILRAEKHPEKTS